MSRTATGSIRWMTNVKTGKPQWHARFSRGDGTRTKYIPISASILEHDRDGALADSARWAPKARSAAAAAKGETVEQYAKRWLVWRAKKTRCATEDKTRLAHALPTVGHLPIATVTRDDMRRLVVVLDGKVKRGFTENTEGRRRPFSWKTAGCVWGVMQAMFRDAEKAKDDRLRVRQDNPTQGVEGPDRGAVKAKVYLWPSEFLSLVSCPRVPLRWRRLFALAVYTYARVGELAALEWKDVDLEHGTIHIHRSKDDQRGRGTNPTKSSTARKPPTEPPLVPLLQAMHAEAKGKGAVVEIPSDGLSDRLRFYLRRAGVERADLFASDETRKAITFHDLRATGITWAAIRGDGLERIGKRAGHTGGFETTLIYLREAENLGGAAFGEVFPELPEDLFGPRSKPGRSIATQLPFAIGTRRKAGKQARSCGPSEDRIPSRKARMRQRTSRMVRPRSASNRPAFGQLVTSRNLP